MPSVRQTPGECIFCAFRATFAPSRRFLRSRVNASSIVATSTFSTSASAARNPSSSTSWNGSRDSRRWEDSPIADRRGARRTVGNGDAVPRRATTDGRLSPAAIKRIILDRLEEIEPRLKSSEIFKGANMSDQDIDLAMGQFRWYLREHLLSDKGRQSPEFQGQQDRLWKSLRQKGTIALDSELQYALYNHFLGKNFTSKDIENQKALADLRYPTEWFPRPRALHRTVHAHIGPTNSGKTYHALKRLERAKIGLYAGPLRLLAHEVYSRMTANGKTCALVTGEEQRLPENWESSETGRVISATVEMTSLGSKYDIAVIDEIQMLGNTDRGNAWTTALLGLSAHEIHVCGEVRALPIIKELAAACGDTLVVHQYDRLTRLKMDERSLGGSLKSLRKGDCIVTFSVVNIHALRTEVERATGKKVAVVYGSLPPETRAQQARLFNEPDNDYDFLIASDAVGMGLNLSIKRVIFESIHKWSGGHITTLTTSEIRQIAGRAGRYRTALQGMRAAVESTPTASVVLPDATLTPDDAKTESSGVSQDAKESTYEMDMTARAAFDTETIGLVTTLDAADFPVVKEALRTEPPPLTYASITPPAGVVQRFAAYFPPGTPLSYILMRLTELSSTVGRYKIDHRAEVIYMADLIEGIPNLSIEDKMILVNAPAYAKGGRDSSQGKLLRELATCIGKQTEGEILKLQQLKLDVLDSPPSGSKKRLKELEELHKGIVLYAWLSFRFPGIFVQRPLAGHIKEIVEAEIEETLRLMTFASESVKRREMMRKRSKVEMEIMRALEEAASKAKDEEEERGATESAEAGYTEEDSAKELVGEMDALAEPTEDVLESTDEGLTREVQAEDRMPQDDEGEYPEGDLEVLKEEQGTAGPATEEIVRDGVSQTSSDVSSRGFGHDAQDPTVEEVHEQKAAHG